MLYFYYIRITEKWREEGEEEKEREERGVGGI